MNTNLNNLSKSTGINVSVVKTYTNLQDSHVVQNIRAELKGEP